MSSSTVLMDEKSLQKPLKKRHTQPRQGISRTFQPNKFTAFFFFLLSSPPLFHFTAINFFKDSWNLSQNEKYATTTSIILTQHSAYTHRFFVSIFTASYNAVMVKEREKRKYGKKSVCAEEE